MSIENLKKKSNYYYIYIFLLFNTLLSVAFFAGTSLESQLNLSGGERFFISSTILFLIINSISVIYLIFGKYKVDGNSNYLLYFFSTIIIFKGFLSFNADENILFSFNAFLLLVLTVNAFLLSYFILGKELYVEGLVNVVRGFSAISVLIGGVMLINGEFPLLFTTLNQFGNYPRMYSWYGNPNIMATTLGVALLLTFKPKNKIETVLSFLFFIGLLFTGSKGVILALILTILIYLLINFIYLKKYSSSFRGKVSIIIFLILSLLLGVSFYDFFYESIFRMNADDISSGSGRLDIWMEVVRTMEVMSSWELLFGMGYGSFSEDFSKSAHSFYVKTIYEDGVLFLIMFFAYIFLSVIRSLKDYNKSSDFVSISYFFICTFLLLRGGSSPTFFQGKVEFYIFLILSIPLFFKSKCKV
ncbi:hypothetical protein L3V43_09870 [Pseudoalteromonas sp. L23]|uniref:O-antigen ligase family protein n=1 Tax=unclassified Pseudoalteromonas TaxID=194690 RepID=UPI001EF0F45C|nr:MULTISPECIES: O-antigen ligase family protein [unclassified Pseudoalteromonas]MCF7513924.1 hypothetical protein [Pseudoalteromonas sp. L7]MCF7525965.1 hypothetical protein [Pseudoalteromonas sp. L23]MCX2766942.1 hypothetical protein [Pseudoalteromonas sp. B530]